MSIPVSAHAAELIINWADNDQVHSEEALEQVSAQTGLNLKLLRPLQRTFDLVNVSGDSEVAINALLSTGHFKHVEENGLVVSPKEKSDLIDVVRFQSQLPQKGTIGTKSLVINKFNDPLYLGQEYLDEQEDTRMGLSSIAKARDYAVKHTNLNRKVRVAVLDTGKWEHEDMVWSEDEASFVMSGWNYVDSRFDSEMGCLTADSTNTGLDVTCSPANVVPQYYSNDATDKSWWDQDGDGVYNVFIDGHGLNVASQIAATSNNNLGMTGIVPTNSVELVPVRVLGSFGGGSNDIANGVWWAIGKYNNGSLKEGDNGYVRPISEPVDVINLSLGGKSAMSCEANSYMQDAISEAYKMNISVVIAVGNESTDTTYVTPANCEEALGIASSKMGGEISTFSNFGQFADIAVHGEEITGATINTMYYGSGRNCGSSASYDDCYSENTGTSMSAPNASGILSLLKLVHPELSAKEREAMLLNTAVPYELNGNGQASRASKVGYGYGVANAYNAISNDALAIESVNVQHRYGEFTSPVQEAYVAQMLEVTPYACSMYNVQFGTLQHPVDGVSYKVMQTNATGDIGSVSFDKTVVADVPRVLVDISTYSRTAVQSCKNGSCGEIVEVNFSNSVSPAICEG